jgi:hypothetical protein
MVGKVMPQLQPSFYSAKSKIILQNNSPIKRLRWALIGKEKSQRIVKELSEINDRLESILESAERNLLRISQTALLRDLISRSSDLPGMDEVKQLLDPSRHQDDAALIAATQLKIIRLMLLPSTSGSDTYDEDIEITALKKLSRRKTTGLESKPELSYQGFEIAQYHQGGYSETVILEWRSFSTDNSDSVLEQIQE